MNTQRERSSSIEHISRPQAIEEIRKILNALSDDDRCACVIAARYGIFCKGFSELSDKEFRQRFFWIVRGHPSASRDELEQLASLYHRGRQQVAGATVCCDVETRDHCACDGWNRFDNATLGRLFQELTGRPVSIR